jgi:hypothetical protein
MLRDLFKQLTADIDKKIAIIGVIFSITFLIYVFTTHKPLELQEMLLVVFFACSIYQFLGNTLKERAVKLFSTEIENSKIYNTKSVFYLSNIIFFCLLSASLIIISQHPYYRPLIFLILVSIMAGILAVEIFVNTNKNYSAFILARILILGILLRASVFYQFPSTVGIDSWDHANFIEQLLIQGHISEYFSSYEYYPAMHILAASLSQITGFSVRDSHFMMGAIPAVSYIFIYLIGRAFFNDKIGLLATLLLALCSPGILWGGCNITAMGFATFFLPVIAFLIFSRNNGIKSIRYTGFIIPFLVLVIVTHTIASAAMLIFLFGVWFAYLAYSIFWHTEKREQAVELTLIFLFSVLLLGYWMFASGFIGMIGSAISDAFRIDTFKGVKLMEVNINIIAISWNYLSLYVFAFFSILGSLCILGISKKKEQSHIPIVISGWCFTFFVFIMFFLGRNFIIFNRWVIFVMILLAIPCAIGILNISTLSSKKTLVVLFMLVTVFAGIMVTDTGANFTQPVPWIQLPRKGLMDSEIHGANTVSKLSNFDSTQGMIYADSSYINIFAKFNVSSVEEGSQILDGEIQEFQGILMLRKEAKDNIIYISDPKTVHSAEFKMNQSMWHSLTEGEEYNTIYDCDTVKGVKCC